MRIMEKYFGRFQDEIEENLKPNRMVMVAAAPAKWKLVGHVLERFGTFAKVPNPWHQQTCGMLARSKNKLQNSGSSRIDAFSVGKTQEVPIMNTALNIQTIISVDRCIIHLGLVRWCFLLVICCRIRALQTHWTEECSPEFVPKGLFKKNALSAIICSFWQHFPYCWWLKSCTTWDVWNPIIMG